MLFKRGSKYYMLYGNCCCFCRAGSGVVVLQADKCVCMGECGAHRGGMGSSDMLTAHMG